MISVLMAALLSSLTSIFNSSSIILTVDLWPRVRQNPSETELLIVGKMSILILVTVSIGWIPIISKFSSSQLYVYIQVGFCRILPFMYINVGYFQTISNFLTPQIAMIFLLGIFWTRTTEQGAFWGLVFGLLPGVARMVLGFVYFRPPCGTEDTRPTFVIQFIDGIHYLHYGAIMFVTTGMITVIISLFTKPIPKEQLHRLTFWTKKSTEDRKELDKDHGDESIVCLRSNDQKPAVEMILNIVAVLSMCLACFVIGYFA